MCTHTHSHVLTRTLRSNRGDDDAGGVLIAEKSSPVFNQTNMYGNRASRFGGAINVQDVATPFISQWYVLETLSD